MRDTVGLIIAFVVAVFVIPPFVVMIWLMLYATWREWRE
jgi:hypothetical protein